MPYRQWNKAHVSALTHLEHEMFSDCQTAHKKVILLDIGWDILDVLADTLAINTDLPGSAQARTLARQMVHQRRLSRATEEETGCYKDQVWVLFWQMPSARGYIMSMG